MPVCCVVVSGWAEVPVCCVVLSGVIVLVAELSVSAGLSVGAGLPGVMGDAFFLPKGKAYAQ